MIVEAIDHAIAEYEHLTRLRVHLPRIFRFSHRADNLAEVYYSERFFAASAAIWSAAFAIDTELAEDMDAVNRYMPPAAALAAAGKGVDKSPLDDQAKARWRRQGVEWLKADLVYWAKQAQAGSPDVKSQVTETLRQWKSDPDLAAIRDEEPLKCSAKMNARHAGRLGRG